MIILQSAFNTYIRNYLTIIGIYHGSLNKVVSIKWLSRRDKTMTLYYKLKPKISSDYIFF